MHLRLASTQDREALIGLIVDQAQQQSIVLTPPELTISPAVFRRPDGTSVFRPRRSTKYSSPELMEAEARLLARADATNGPRLTVEAVGRLAAQGRRVLSTQQRAALQAIATSGRGLDVLIGPAGAGKTTAMSVLKAGWIRERGRGSVVGLAPSAAAAQALAADLGIECDNTAKWLHEHDRGNVTFLPGQLVILDEASLAGTLTLDRITTLAEAVGAKVLLVGDDRQLQPVEAGGAFSLLIERRNNPPRLTEIRRFTHDWEKGASLKLQQGNPEVIATYAVNDRIRDGGTADMLDAAYEAWRADILAGKASILLTESARAVRELNQRARAERLILDGASGGREVDVADDLQASEGDIVITRRNDRALRTTRGAWVRNGDRWKITAVRNDGSLVVQHSRGRRHGGLVLPAAYVREHVDLGYAVTAHRAQGITTDTAHVLVTPATTRENLYVSMTRGRESNISYVALDQPDDLHTTPEPDEISARTVLHGVLRHVGGERSVHQTIADQHNEYGSIAKLAAELETIAADAQRSRYADLLAHSGLTPEQCDAALDSTAFGPLAASLRLAEANHHDLEHLLPALIRQHRLDDANDIAAVLCHRIHNTTSRPGGSRAAPPRLIAGLIPEPIGPMSTEHRQAIKARSLLIEDRARELATAAMRDKAPWVQRLLAGTAGADPDHWLPALAAVAAYRDRYEISSDAPFGGVIDSQAQRHDRERAQLTVRAMQAAGSTHQPNGSRVGVGVIAPDLGS